jgi:hypothetical protein
MKLKNLEVKMIKANELRIGNFFYPDVDGDAYAQITAKDILELYSDPIDDYYKALPLTEEWLIKFGFEKVENGCLFKNIINYWNFFLWEKSDYIDLVINKSSIRLSIKYVHQLQNLYFSLTGEELEVSNDN